MQKTSKQQHDSIIIQGGSIVYTYKTSGVCSRSIDFEVENGVVTACSFNGGCTGNTKGVANLVIGMPVDEVIARLKGISCRGNTSCPDQLAKALEQYKAQAAL